ncbi:MAG: TIR domain-containing protein [Anaerolineales bacterium]
MTDSDAKNTSKVFISYSRKNKEFVQSLHAALKSEGFDIWVDWEGIPPSADWMAEISAAIEGADAFIFVLSPDSLASKVCGDELELGIKYNKRLVPVLYRDPEKGTAMHEKLAATNWIYLREQDNFSVNFPKVVESITTDLDWVKQHTRLLQRAREWDQKKRDSGFLLDGTELEESEHWMTESAGDEKRNALPLQAEYISTSRKIAVQRQRNLMIGIAIALVVSIMLGVYALFQRNVAVTNEQIAKAQRTAAKAEAYQNQIGKLYTSTLLSINALQQKPDLAEAENILRQNLSMMVIPVAHMNQGGTIWSLQTSPDGKTLATASSAKTACVWDASNGKQLYCVKHDDIVRKAIYSEGDSPMLITVSDDGSVRFWNVKDGSPIKRLDLGGIVWDEKIHPDGQWLGVVASSGAYVIDLKDLSIQTTFPTSSDAKTVDFDPTGQWMAYGTASGETYLWNIAEETTITGPKHDGEVFDISFSPDGTWLASAGADSMARVAETSTGQEKYAFLHGDWVEDVTFGKIDNWLATASDDNTARIWDLSNGQEIMRLRNARYVQKVRFSRDGKWLYTTGYDKTFRVWGVSSGVEMLEIPTEGIGISMYPSKDGTRLYTVDDLGNIHIWDISKLTARTAVVKFSDFVHEAVFNPTGEWLLVNTDDSHAWQIKTDQMTDIRPDALGNTVGASIFTVPSLTYEMAISPDSKWVAAVEYDEIFDENNHVVLTNIASQKQINLNNEGAEATGVVFTPDGKTLVSSAVNSKVYFWDVETGKALFSLETPQPVESVAVSPTGKWLVAGLDGGMIVWDLTTKTQVMKWNEPVSAITVAFSKDGNWLAAGGDDNNIYLWKIENGAFKQSAENLPANGTVNTIAFSPDGRWIAGGDSASLVYIWDLSTLDELTRIPHPDEVTSVSFSPDGKELVTVARKTVQMWDTSKLSLIKRDDLITTACSHLLYNLNETEWEAVSFGENYQLICPNLPVNSDE